MQNRIKGNKILKIEKKSIEKNKIRFYYYIGSILGCPNPPFFLAHFLDRNFVFDHLFSNSCIFKNFSNIKIQ